MHHASLFVSVMRRICFRDYRKGWMFRSKGHGMDNADDANLMQIWS